MPGGLTIKILFIHILRAVTFLPLKSKLNKTNPFNHCSDSQKGESLPMYIGNSVLSQRARRTRSQQGELDIK